MMMAMMTDVTTASIRHGSFTARTMRSVVLLLASLIQSHLMDNDDDPPNLQPALCQEHHTALYLPANPTSIQRE